MKIKGLLLGSAAAMLAASGARAADAIVIAEPEPMEYVRICDVYGAGFFYIPGTENCLKIGGYYRYEVQTGDVYGGDDGYVKLARFAPNFTVSTETGWGTLTGYAELEFDWYSIDGSQTTNLYSAYIQLGGLLIGKHDTPYARFLGYGGPTMWEGAYGYNNSSEISYTFTAGNGFSAIVALVEDIDGVDWAPNVEAGFNLEKDWGSIGAIAGYDEVGESFGAKAVGRLTVPNTAIEASLHVFYGSTSGTPGVYHIYDPVDGTATEWSVLAGASTAFTDQLGIAATAQWFDTDAWEVSVNLPWSPIDGLTITPEVVYATSDSADADLWNGRIRFQRSF